MKTPDKETVISEMRSKSGMLEKSANELIKSPFIAEFLGLKRQETYLESDLENSILTHLSDFLLEMGRGFAFVGRQQHIVTDTEDYFIDLVFYNIELKCYVLIDLKMGKITHQDVGQIDMYVRMYDEFKRREGDNPTIGILLCSETSEDIARFSVLHDNDRLFMSKYLTYLPTKEQLRHEIESQKEIFYLQHHDKAE
ncbi:MAG TPA: PDDEXK nuclease domain-containing protein [Methanocorpusculum sp.]|nr:PDDEXK nuclease domain-containing protein [Methanocorpusculum sp.]